MSREAMKLALEALEYIHEGANNQGPHTGISWRCVSNKAESAITALREALAEPQEKYQYGTPLLDAMTGKANEALDKMAENARELGLDYEPAQQPAQQEPVAWRNAALRVGEDLCSVGPFGYYDMTAEQWLDWALSVVTVHTPPAQRKPLTDEEIILIVADCASSHQHTDIHFARAIEAKLKEKNNG